MNEYANLDTLRAYLTGSNVPMADDDDDRLLMYLSWASRRIEGYCRRTFFPVIASRYFNYQKSRDLVVDKDLLAVSALSAGGTAVSSSDYWLYPLNTYPKWMIQIDKSKSAIFSYSGTSQRAVTVTGTWGYHNDWDNAWVDTGDTVQDNPLTSSNTLLAVDDIDGYTVEMYAPRICAGDLLKIEDEYVAVTETNDDKNTAVVRRGVNGSTAASHIQTTAIYVYRPPEVITNDCLALVKFIYETRSAVGGIVALPTLEGAAIRAGAKSTLADFDLPIRDISFVEFV